MRTRTAAVQPPVQIILTYGAVEVAGLLQPSQPTEGSESPVERSCPFYRLPASISPPQQHQNDR